MGLQDVAFLPPELLLTPHLLKIVVEVKASGSPHVLRLWLTVSKGMLPVKYFCSNKASFLSAKFGGDHKTVTKIR